MRLIRAKAFGPQAVSGTAWSFAALGVRESSVVSWSTVAAAQPAPRFGERELSNTAWAFASLGLSHRPLLDAISSGALPRMWSFRAQGLAGTAWALAMLGVPDLSLLDALAAQSVTRVDEMKPQELGNMAWALATLEVCNLPLLSALSGEAVFKISKFTPQEHANTAWAFARLCVDDGTLLAAISSASRRQLAAFALQELANLAWAVAVLGMQDAPLLHAISAAAHPKLKGLPEAGENPMAAVALVEAFEAAHVPGGSSSLFLEAAAAIKRCAAVLDGKVLGAGTDVTEFADSNAEATQLMGSSLAGVGLEPSVVMQRHPLVAIWKPPGWSVAVGGGAGRRSTATSERGRAKSRGLPLDEWLSSSPLAERHHILGDPGAQHGLLHRLDLETSGVLCCSVSYRGYYLGLLQFVSRRVHKAYLCLCHGCASAERRLVEVPLLTAALWPGGPLRSRASARGRPACTELCAVAHLSHADGTTFSLVEVRLHTGRTHQIRAHLAGEGHPLVADAAYGGVAEPWCPRVFLHSSRLVLDVGDGPFDMRSPLPADLCEALGTLAAVGEESKALLAQSLGA